MSLVGGNRTPRGLAPAEYAWCGSRGPSVEVLHPARVFNGQELPEYWTVETLVVCSLRPQHKTEHWSRSHDVSWPNEPAKRGRTVVPGSYTGNVARR